MRNLWMSILVLIVPCAISQGIAATPSSSVRYTYPSAMGRGVMGPDVNDGGQRAVAELQGAEARRVVAIQAGLEDKEIYAYTVGITQRLNTIRVGGPIATLEQKKSIIYSVIANALLLKNLVTVIDSYLVIKTNINTRLDYIAISAMALANEQKGKADAGLDAILLQRLNRAQYQYVQEQKVSYKALVEQQYAHALLNTVTNKKKTFIVGNDQINDVRLNPFQSPLSDHTPERGGNSIQGYVVTYNAANFGSRSGFDKASADIVAKFKSEERFVKGISVVANDLFDNHRGSFLGLQEVALRRNLSISDLSMPVNAKLMTGSDITIEGNFRLMSYYDSSVYRELSLPEDIKEKKVHTAVVAAIAHQPQRAPYSPQAPLPDDHTRMSVSYNKSMDSAYLDTVFINAHLYSNGVPRPNPRDRTELKLWQTRNSGTKATELERNIVEVIATAAQTAQGQGIAPRYIFVGDINSDAGVCFMDIKSVLETALRVRNVTMRYAVQVNYSPNSSRSSINPSSAGTLESLGMSPVTNDVVILVTPVLPPLPLPVLQPTREATPTESNILKDIKALYAMELRTRMSHANVLSKETQTFDAERYRQYVDMCANYMAEYIEFKERFKNYTDVHINEIVSVFDKDLEGRWKEIEESPYHTLRHYDHVISVLSNSFSKNLPSVPGGSNKRT